MALASELNLPLYFLSLEGLLNGAGGGMMSRFQSGQNELATLFSTVQPRSIILIEDVDHLFGSTPAVSSIPFEQQHNKEKPEATAPSGPSILLDRPAPAPFSLSTLLSCMDGVLSPEGVLIILTANDRDKLPAALVREGRIDLQIEFYNARRTEVRQLFLNLYGKNHEDEATTFASRMPDGVFSMAKIHSYLCAHPRVEDALDERNLEALLPEPQRAIASEEERKGPAQPHSAPSSSA
jgi:chaperone BCS1